MTVSNRIHHTPFSSEPSPRISNSQPAGIGRVATAGGYILVNNLGRDVSIFNSHLQKIAVFDDTVFPGQDWESQFDLDAHALLVDPIGNLWFINHYGLIRVFDGGTIGWSLSSSPSTTDGDRQLAPILTSTWAGDVERFEFLWPYLLSSSPKGYSSPTAAHPGVLISEKLDDWLNRAESLPTVPKDVPIQQNSYLEEWGILSGFALSTTAKLLAVASRNRLGCYALVQNEIGLKPDKCLFDCTVDFAVTWMEFVGDKLVVAGPRKGSEVIQPVDWEELTGGGWALINVLDGTVSHSTEFDVPIAWGNGAEPLGVLVDAKILVGFDRGGNIHAWDIDTASKIPTSAKQYDGSRGLAHAAIAGGTAIVGFNRDGYQLHKFVIIGEQ